MPDLSSLPPQLIGPFAVVFALALFVSKIFDILEKWMVLKSNKKADRTVNQVNGKKATPSINFKDVNSVVGEKGNITTKGIFLYSFLGAISINVLSSVIQIIFINAPGYLISNLIQLGYSSFFGFVSAIICAFFIKNKFPLISRNYIVTVLMGFAVSAIISMPVNLILLIVQINRMYN